jgi:hypothetical protein
MGASIRKLYSLEPFLSQGMSDQSKRRVRVIGATIVVGALVVSASVLFAAYGFGGSRTVTKTVTSASATTNLITTTITSTEVSASIPLHMVTFNESGECGAYADTWAVTLGNITIAQPSNATLPISTEEGVAGGAYKMISKIIFTVPDGVYQYDVTSGWSLFPSGGTVDVNGSDVVVQLEGPAVAGPCAAFG